MKKFALFFCLCALVGSAEEVTITKSTMLKADHSAVSLKAGTVVELISREDKTLTVRYNKLTGTIPAASAAAAGEPAKKEVAKPAELPPPPRKAETTYGKAVEKARENAAKHEKSLVKPADEVIEK
jgi:pyruvate/2-oxoglutarate dehydrogenase complex dihydrolipoamide acyltransferase (E2) component